jgi:hypothetical protein
VGIISITALMMEGVRTYKLSVHSNESSTRRYIPEGSKLRARSRENLKSHLATLYGRILKVGGLCALLSKAEDDTKITIFFKSLGAKEGNKPVNVTDHVDWVRCL